MSKGRLTPEEIEYVQEQLAQVKVNILHGTNLEKSLDLFKNLVVHCNENIFDREAARLKMNLETFLIRQLEKNKGAL